MTSCEFCMEIHDPRISRFATIYGDALPSRILRTTASFVVLPTLGQMFAGSLLVVPTRHVETLAGVPELTDELMALVEELKVEVSAFGRGVFFEHGARCVTQGGCGIYHAHLHCVPLPRSASAWELLPRGGAITGLAEGLRALRDSSQYLIVQDDGGQTLFVDLDGADPTEYGSQYFRRRIAQLFGAPLEWDWRKYTQPEPYLLQTVAAFVESAGQH